MAQIDLHMHSSHSDDGEYSVEQLVAVCAQKQIKMGAITDHNSVQGVPRAIHLGQEAGVKILAGVELDCVYDGVDFHLLGYGFDYTNSAFAVVEQDIYRQEMAATSEKIAKWNKAMGIPLTEEEVFAAADGAVVTGELIGEIILQKPEAERYDVLKPYRQGGAKSDMPYVNLYWDFFSQGKVAYVPIQYLSLVAAKELIQTSGGVAVLAHPGQNLQGDFSRIDAILQEGIDGIEVFSSYHTPATAQYFLDKAKEYNLLVTCGSDFHGKNKPHIQIGDCDGTVSETAIMQALAAKL